MTAARDNRSLAGGPADRPSEPPPRGPVWTGREPDGYETSGTPRTPGHAPGGHPDDSVFDIADDRLDDGTSMTYPPGLPGQGPRAPHRETPRDPGHATTTSMALDPAYGDVGPRHGAAPQGPDGPAQGYGGMGLPAPREAEASNDLNELVSTLRGSLEAIAPRTDELTQLFYGWLFRLAPETRELFPVTMELQRTRFLRGLLHSIQSIDRPEELAIFLRQLGRDHRKFGVVDEHYDVVGEALLGAAREVSGPAWSEEVEQAWGSAYSFTAAVMREAAEAERGPAVWMARVMEHRRLSQDLAIVRVQTSQPVPYLAGQYVSVETPQRPRMWRSMSPANAPGNDCVLEFHVRTVPGGWVSRAIVSHARVGDVWRIGPPMGQMTLDPRSRSDLLMVAGGTGVAPARAIIEQLVHEGTDRKVCLFVGGRTWEDLYAIDSLRRSAQENPWLTVVGVVEDDGRRHGAETGTVGEVVARYGAWADRQTVVAGSPPMVRSTVSAMLEAGTPFTRIHYDPYHTD